MHRAQKKKADGFVSECGVVLFVFFSFFSVAGFEGTSENQNVAV